MSKDFSVQDNSRRGFENTKKMASKTVILICLMALIGQLWAIPVPDDENDDGKSLFYESILQLVNWDELFVILIAYFTASQINRVLI